jgi:hypothetical protein
MEFSVSLDGKIDFSKCRRFTVRGYNKVGLYSTLSKEIKDCSAFDPLLIKPNIVIDAVGTPDISRGDINYFPLPNTGLNVDFHKSKSLIIA